MKKRIFTIALCAASAAFAQEPMTYKGVPLGATLVEFKAAMPDFLCGADSVCRLTATTCFDSYYTKEGSSAVDICKAKYTFGGVTPSLVRATFINGKLSSVYFSLKVWHAVDLERALKIKLGEPTIVPRPFTTKGGAFVDNKVPTWQTSDYKVYVDFNYYRVGEAGAVLEAPNHEALLEASKQPAAQTGAKDF